MDKRKPRATTQRITRKKTSAPKAARKGPLAEDAVAEIAASPPPPALAVTAHVLEVPALAETLETPEPAAPPPVILIEARIPATDDEPTTRVVFRARPVHVLRPQGWQLVRAILRRVRSEIEMRSAPARAEFTRRFPRLALLGRMLGV